MLVLDTMLYNDDPARGGNTQPGTQHNTMNVSDPARVEINDKVSWAPGCEKLARHKP